jgi:hypothetical protein
MENLSPKDSFPAKKALENYAISYMGAYLNTVKKERPDHEPFLARSQFYEIEVNQMPNSCIAMLFEKSDKQNVVAKTCDWDHVEGKVMSGVAYLVTVYAHEGISVADAIARGKKDAIRDIRALEDSSISKAVTQLEKILQGMSRVGKNNKSTMDMGGRELAKLEPIKDAIRNAGPEIDMLQMIDALKNYPGIQAQTCIGDQEKELLQRIVNELGDMSDVIRRAEAQDKKLEELEQSMKKALSEFNRTMDERVSKGLAVILQASDKKIDKGFSAFAGTSKHPSDLQLPKDLETRLERIEKTVAAAAMMLNDHPSGGSSGNNAGADLEKHVAAMEKALERLEAKVQDGAAKTDVSVSLPKNLEERLEMLDKSASALQTQVQQWIEAQQAKTAVHEELVLAVADVKENIARTNNRIIKIEEFLQQASGARVRTLKQKPQ